MIELIQAWSKRLEPAARMGAIRRRIFPWPRPPGEHWKQLLRGKVGLEIGGPSPIFSRGNDLELYPVLGRLDNCNFSRKDIWHDDPPSVVFTRRKRGRVLGKQYFAEAVSMDMLPSGAYDFVLSSHVIEHIANPLGALLEWKRILREQGVLVLVVPHKEGTFDHRRPVTTLVHLIHDFDNNTDERDLTHLPEILALHDLERDVGAGSHESFRTRSECNFHNRCLHHHVFDTGLVLEMLDHLACQIISIELLRPYHIVVVAQSVSRKELVNNTPFLHKQAEYRWRSPFKTDRR